MGLTTGAEALRAARWVNPILVHSVHKVHYVHTFDERLWTPTAVSRFTHGGRFTLKKAFGSCVGSWK